MSASTSDQKDSHVSPVHDDISRLKNKNGDKTNESVSSYTASTSIRDTDTRAKPTDKLLGKPKRDVPKPNTRDTDTTFTKNNPGNKRRSSGSGSDTNNYDVVYTTTTEIRSLLTTPDTAHDTPIHEQRNRTYNNTRTYWFEENGVHWYTRTDKINGRYRFNRHRCPLSQLRWFDSLETLQTDTSPYRIIIWKARERKNALTLTIKPYGKAAVKVIAEQSINPCSSTKGRKYSENSAVSPISHHMSSSIPMSMAHVH